MFSSCQTETSNDHKENSETSESQESESANVYLQDWKAFKSAVISKDKDAVLFFALKSDQSLKDVLEMSFDYIFDDQMIENIQNLDYDDLSIHEQNNQWKVLITYYPSGSEEEIEDSASGTYLFFEERPEGLRIVNFLAAG